MQAFNRRQAMQQEHESLSRTAVQFSMEIAAMKNIAEAQSGTKLSPATLSQELMRLGLLPVITGSKGSGPGNDEEEGSSGCLSPNFITAALHCHKWILSSPECIELLMQLEAQYGTRSPFHKMSTLVCLATKPSSAKSRHWILTAIADWIGHGLLKCSDVTKSALAGDKHHVGLLALHEFKLKARLTLI